MNSNQFNQADIKMGTNVYYEGENAYKNKKLETICPYSLNTIEWKLWMEGYTTAAKLDAVGLLM